MKKGGGGLFCSFFSFFTRAKLFCIQVLHIAAAFYGREPIGEIDTEKEGRKCNFFSSHDV